MKASITSTFGAGLKMDFTKKECILAERALHLLKTEKFCDNAPVLDYD